MKAVRKPKVAVPAIAVRDAPDRDLYQRLQIVQTPSEQFCFGRGATIEGSRAFQRPVEKNHKEPRRVARVEWGVCDAMRFKRRAATRTRWPARDRGLTPDRGLKPTATVIGSRRDRAGARTNRNPIPAVREMVVRTQREIKWRA